MTTARFLPPIVVQTRLRTASGAWCAPCFVGVMPWQAPADFTTVVVRAAYGLSEDETAFEAVAMTKDVDQGDQEASPWALSKAACDLGLIGSAYHTEAASSIALRMALDAQFERRLFARGPSPRGQIPLSAEYLFDEDGTRATPVTPGQLTSDMAAVSRPRSTERERDTLALGPDRTDALARATEASWRERALRAGTRDWHDLRPSFYIEGSSCGQWAAPTMQAGFVTEADRLILEGLHPSGEPLDLPLCPHQLLVVAEGAQGTYDVEMRIDSVLFDSDRQQLMIEWRGHVPEALLNLPTARLLVDRVEAEKSATLAQMEARLSRGHFSRAEVPPHIECPALREPDIALSLARQAMMAGPVQTELDEATFNALAEQRSVSTPQRWQELLAQSGFDDLDWSMEERAWAERRQWDRMTVLHKQTSPSSPPSAEPEAST